MLKKKKKKAPRLKEHSKEKQIWKGNLSVRPWFGSDWRDVVAAHWMAQNFTGLLQDCICPESLG